VECDTLVLQIERVGWRGTLAGCKAVVHQQPDTNLTLNVGARRVGNYTAKGVLLPPRKNSAPKAVDKSHPTSSTATTS
jgi:hypothetical protein